MIELRTLGHVELTIGDSGNGDALLAQPKRLALFCYLALPKPGTMHRRDTLLGVFWPESDQQHARMDLRQALTFLRRTLGEDVLRKRGPDEIGVDPDRVWSDVAAFEQAIERGDWTRAVELHRGEFLTGFFLSGEPEFEQWLDATRTRLRAAYGTALRGLADAATTAGDLEAATAWCRKLVEHEPYSTREVLRCMEAMHAAGDRAGALGQAERHAGRLRADLDAAPSPEVLAYADRLRQQPAARTGPDAYEQGRAARVERLERVRDGEEMPPSLEPSATPSGGGTATKTAAVAPDRSWQRRDLLKTSAILAVVTVVALGWWTTERRSPLVTDTTAAPIPIAVLVFETQQSGEDAESFVEGIADDINTKLSMTDGFLVKAHVSVRRLSRREMEYSDIAAALGVDYLVHGSVRYGGDSVRITARLIDPETEVQRWAGEYTREYTATNMFAVTTDVAEQVAGALSVAFSPAELKQLAARPTVSTEAYNAYRYGQFFWNKRTDLDLQRALTYFERAIELDSNYAMAYVGLAETFALLTPYYVLEPHLTFPQAELAARRALELDSSLGQAHTVLAWASLVYDWDWADAEREFLRALSLSPAHATTHHWYAFVLMVTGRFSEAGVEMRRAQDLDPLSPIIASQAGHPSYYARDYDRAVEVYEEALLLESHFPLTHAFLADTYAEMGKHDEALASAERAIALIPNPPSIQFLWHLGYAQAASGRIRDALETLDELKERSARQYVPADLIAGIYAALGDRDRALEWLARAYDERCWGLIWLAVAPEYDLLRSDSRFQELIRRMDFPQ